MRNAFNNDLDTCLIHPAHFLQFSKEWLPVNSLSMSQRCCPSYDSAPVPVIRFPLPHHSHPSSSNPVLLLVFPNRRLDTNRSIPTALRDPSLLSLQDFLLQILPALPVVCWCSWSCAYRPKSVIRQ